MNTPDEEYFNHPIVNPRYLNKVYPEFYRYLVNNYNWCSSISESLYSWRHNIKDTPLCPVCRTPLKFIGINKGYSKYCSLKCSNSDPFKKEVTKQTCIKKYGYDNPQKSKEIQDKSKQTCLEKYGVENPFQSELIKNKIKQVNLERHRVEYTGQIEEAKQKSKQTCLEKYGAVCGAQTDKAKYNLKQSLAYSQINKHPDIIDVDYESGEYICSCPYPKCNKCNEKQYNIKITAYFDRNRNHTEPCTKILPFNPERCKGTTLELFAREILNQYNIQYETNNRSILDGKELDIYIPSKKIAIECNGVYWHSLKPHTYHENKYKECQSKGIQLLTIWEDWIINKPDIVKSIILSKLGLNKTIGARQCIIKDVSTKESNKFLDLNHIQGKSQSKVRLGLYYNGMLVSLMTFGSRQTMASKKEGEWDLIRFCNTKGYNVIGGASRLLKHFIYNYHPDVIYSFSSNDISDGGLYKKLGFICDIINQSYWYVDSRTMKRYHRSSFTKDSIVKMGWKSNKDGWTESEVMNEHRYYQIYDSGQTKWILNLK